MESSKRGWGVFAPGRSRGVSPNADSLTRSRTIYGGLGVIYH